MKLFSYFFVGEAVFIRFYDTDFKIKIIFIHSLHSFAVYKMLPILIIIINVLLTIDNNCIYNLGILSHRYCANLSYGFPEEFLQSIAIFRNDIVRKEK